MLLMALLEKHVFEDVEQVVDSLGVQLGVLILVGIQVIFGSSLRLFWLQRVPSHVDDGQGADG